ncbi:unnamed protein product [Boreogadus saida]
MWRAVKVAVSPQWQHNGWQEGSSLRPLCQKSLHAPQDRAISVAAPTLLRPAKLRLWKAIEGTCSSRPLVHMSLIPVSSCVHMLLAPGRSPLHGKSTRVAPRAPRAEVQH